MRKASTRALYDYWNTLRGSRSAPDRRDIDPTRIRSALANTFILESNDATEFTFRLAGSHLCSAYCRELKGRSFNKLWQQKDRDAIETLIRAVTEDHAAAVVNLQGSTPQGGTANFELMLLPLRHNGSTTARMIGSMTAFEEPYWFGMHPVMEQRITGLRLIWPDEIGAPDVDSINAAELHDLAAGADVDPVAIPVKVQGISARRYQHLAVIDGGKARN